MVWQKYFSGVLPFLDLQLFRIGNTAVTVATLFSVGGIVLLTFLTTRIVQKWLNRMASSRDVQQAGSIAVTERLVRYGIMFIGFGIVLRTIGIDLTALFAAGALFAVAIGFAMQNIASNFVSGVILLFERSIKPGDVVEVDGRLMSIREMGIRSTIARALNEEDLIIPNSLLVQSTVKNFTLRDTLYRLDAMVGVVYGSDMLRVRETLSGAAAGIAWRSTERDPVILMKEFGSSSVDFMVSVWTDDPWNLRQLRSDLNEAIWWALKKEGITIAFPQVDVHLDSSVERALESLKAT